MGEVDMQTLKDLRAITQAPLKDCKDALQESGGDLERAQKILREKGAIKAANKADRATNEGVVMIKQYGDKTVGLKLACETDFVAKNDTFRSLATQIVDQLSNEQDFASYAQLWEATKEAVNTVLKDNFVTIGENMQILDAFVATGNAYVYRHPGDKVASVVFYAGDENVAKEVALQVAAMQPTYLSVDDVPAETVNELTTMFSAELKESNKPADIVEKIVAGKLAKEWGELVLLEQTSIVDDTKKIKDRLWTTVIQKYIRYGI